MKGEDTLADDFHREETKESFLFYAKWKLQEAALLSARRKKLYFMHSPFHEHNSYRAIREHRN